MARTSMGVEEGGRRVALLDLENYGLLMCDGPLQQGQAQHFEL
jgi:hypothetical protein